MTHYINLEKKRLVGRNNQPIPPLQTDYSTVTDEVFTFIDSNNKIIEIPASGGLYYAGSLKMNQSPSSLLWLCEDFTISGNQLTFNNIDTYTSGYMREIKKKYTEVNIEIGVSDGENKKVFLRDTALANPRVYIDGIDPHDIPIPDFATKEYVDAAVSGKQDLITQTNKLAYDLVSGAPSVPSSIVEDVTVNGSSIVQNSTAAIPLAKTNSLGLMKVSSAGYGLAVNSEHVLYVTRATLSEITTRDNAYKPITPYDLNFAVKSSLTDINHITLTSAEQATAQAVFNVPGLNANGKIEYSMLDNVPAIPSAVSDLMNDSGFATSSYVDEALSGKLDAVTPVITSTDPYILNLSGNASYIWDLSESTYTATIQATGVSGQEQTWAVDIKLGASASVFYYFGFKADECDSLTANKVNHCVVRWDGTYARLYCYAINDLA